MFEKNITSIPESRKSKKNKIFKKVLSAGMATGMIAGATEKALASQDTTSESQNKKTIEHKMQTNYEEIERKRIEEKIGGKIITTKSEKQENLQLFVSGTIDGKDKFEIYQNDYNLENDRELMQAIKKAEEKYFKSFSKKDLEEYDQLEKKASSKEFEIFVNGKKVHIINTELYRDGGSRSFKTDMGYFFIAHPEAGEMDARTNTVKKKESKFSTDDEKEHSIQVDY